MTQVSKYSETTGSGYVTTEVTEASSGYPASESDLSRFTGLAQKLLQVPKDEADDVHREHS